MKIYTGKYKGSGVSGRVIITPLNPKLVIVKRVGASAAIWKSDTMTGHRSSYFGPTTDITTGILELGDGQFTLGTANEVNAANQEYTFIAFEDEGGDLETGSYVGNATDSQTKSFTGTHADPPKLLLIKEELSTDPVIWKDNSMNSDSAATLDSTPTLGTPNLVQALDQNGFQIGDSTKINALGVNYHWVALFEDTEAFITGTYTGSGADRRVVENTGIQIDALLIFNETTGTDPVINFKNVLGDSTFPLIAASDLATNKIQAVYRDDFELGTHASVNTNLSVYRYFVFRTSDWSVEGKYPISLDGMGYLIQKTREGRPLYEKKPTQEFVSKFGSGDSSYRDSSFWQFWAQINWRNGAKQLRFDDAGKFWKSENIDVTQLETLRLSKLPVLAGQIRAGTKVLAMSAFRSSQNWWDANYGYRQRLTITAPGGSAIPVGYPIKLAVDSAALEGQSRVREDRKDWRVVYWNGSSWTDLARDYVTTTKTIFATQAEIPAGGTDNNYYLHYGFTGETTDKQPNTDALWNEVYGMYGGAAGSTIDSPSLAVWHMKEGSGTAAADTDSTLDLGWSDNSAWSTDGPFGRSLAHGNGNEDSSAGVQNAALDVGSFTLELWRWSSQPNGVVSNYGKDSDANTVKFKIQIDSNTKIYFEKRTGPTVSQSATTGTGVILNDSAWHHYAFAYDGVTTMKIYRDGVLVATANTGGSSGIRSATGRLHFFRDAGQLTRSAHIRISNTERTTFPYATVGAITASADAEQTTTPPESTFSLYAGLSDGSIHLWDGNDSWTEVFDVRRLVWFESGTDTTKTIGDVGGTETAQAQGFQLAATTKIKAIQVHLKKLTGTPGPITVRIETNSTDKPSGTLADANGVAEIPAFTTTDAGWVTVEFPESFTLTASTTYWIVLKTGIPSGLLVYYPLESDATDVIGAVNGVETSVTHNAQKVGNGADFNGTTSKIIITNTIASQTAFSISCWVRPDETASSKKYFTRDEGGGTDWGWFLGQDTANKFEMGFQTSGGFRTLVSETVFTPGTRYHVVATYDGTTARIYVNGALDNSVVFNSAGEALESTTNKEMRIGCLNGTTQLVDAQIDEMNVWGVAMTLEQIQYQYNSGSGRAFTGSDNDQNYAWTAKSTSGIASVTMAVSTDGGATWTAVSAADAYFRVLGPASRINCALLTKVGGTQKIQWGTGLPESEVNGDARLYSFDGTTWKLEKIFLTATESCILSLHETQIGADQFLMLGIGPQGKIYKTSDLSTYTLSKDIDKPQGPGYPYALFEYNRLFFAAGGSPEFLDDKMYNGFFYAFDQADWISVLPFDFTVIKSMQFYDAFLFLGSYHGQLFVFNTVTLDPLFNFFDDYEYQVQVWCLYFFDDKLWIGLVPQNGVTALNEGIWIFDRHGMSQLLKISGVEGYYSMVQVNNELFIGTGDDGNVYRLSRNTYSASGYLQTSYFDALLPSIPKLWNSMIVQFDPLPTGTNINIYYRFLETDAWTQLDETIDTPDTTTAELTFPTGITSKKISFKVELITSNNLVTPTIREYVLKYSLYPERKWQWNLRLLAKDYAKLLDNSRDPRTGVQIRQDIEAAQESGGLNTFIDQDGKTHQVLFHTLDQDSWVINQDREGSEGTIAVTLLEA